MASNEHWSRLIDGLLGVYGIYCSSELMIPRLAALLRNGDPLYLRQILAPLLINVNTSLLTQYLRTPCDDHGCQVMLESLQTLLLHDCLPNHRYIDLGVVLSIFADASRSLSVRVLAAQLLADLVHLPVASLFELLRGPGDELERALVSHVRVTQRPPPAEFPSAQLLQVLTTQCPLGTLVEDLYLPCRENRKHTSSLANIPTTRSNRRRLSSAILTEQPILLYGEIGCGKSSLIRDLAAATGQLEHLVEVYIDSQTDARAMLGAYVCSDIPGEFVWRNGTELLSRCILTCFSHCGVD